MLRRNPQVSVDARRRADFPATGLRVVDGLKLHNEGRTGMASSGKKKTTMAKLNRESRLRERRLDKQMRKDARKQAAAAHPGEPGDTLTGQSDEPGAGQPAVDPAVPVLADG
jgi:hypothetical protein